MKLTGNTIFITGGGSGIGRGLAEALHKLGNKVVIAGRRRSRLDEVIARNPGMEAVELDIADPRNIDEVAAKLIADYPDLDVLIDNAGIMEPDAAAGKIDDPRTVATLTTNLAPPWTRTELMNSAEAEGAMPLDDFIAETIAVMGTDAGEVLVEAAKPARGNPGPNEHGQVDRFNAQMMTI